MLGLWLRMNSFPRNGFTIASSEATYNANGSIALMVYPHHGGTLQADGTWTQNNTILNNDFSQALPATASGWGQTYIPGVGCDSAGILTVMDSATLMQTAVDNLLALARSSRFDSPWDGVALDLEVIRLDYRDKLSTFQTMIANAFHAIGMTVVISVKGKSIDGGDWAAGSYRYTQDYTILDGIADYVDMRCYGYEGAEYTANDKLNYIGPYRWVKSCIEYALSAGVPAGKLMVGVGNFSRYWADKTISSTADYSIADAASLIGDAATYTTWIENDGTGIIREVQSVLNGDQVWLRDHNSMKHYLGLIDEYGLIGANLFVPGMGTSDIWTALSDWVSGITPWHGYISVENLNLAAGEYSSLLAIIQGQGRLSNSQPSNITHSRTLSGTEEIVEAVFRYGEMAQDQAIQWVAAVLDVDPADVSCGVVGNVWTLSHGGTDYVTLTLFGGIDSSWINSGAACRAYIG